jgi:hypothetical protein
MTTTTTTTTDPILDAAYALIAACDARRAEITEILGEVRNDSQGPLFTEYQALMRATMGAQKAIRARKEYADRMADAKADADWYRGH